MREVTVFYAYDDTEFYDRDECEYYEGKAFDKLEELFNAYAFYYANGQEIQIFLNNVEDGLYYFECAWNDCHFIRVKQIPSLDAEEFLYINLGFDMPPNELGLYEYDMHNTEWVKVE